MQIVRYTPEKTHEWNTFIEGSRNGTFLFLRGYMDYHSDRFHDHSLMYYSDKGKLLAVMAANEAPSLWGRAGERLLYSHQGLTYGGFILAPKVHATEVGEMFDVTLKYLKKNGFSEWYYKQMPSIYHKLPSQEDEYWLWRNNALVTHCNEMTAVDLKNYIHLVSPRKRTYFNRFRRQGVEVEINSPIQDFWPILEGNLMERFNSKPVHSLSEMTLLQNRFPKNIICCVARNSIGTVIAGTLLYISDQVVRTQYISASHEGKRTNALDFLMLSLIDYYKKIPQYNFFDFGTSMEDDEVSLNEGLILQKEGFGGRGIACKTYRIPV